MQTVFELLRKASSRLPDASAIVDVESGNEWSYRALVAKVEAVAAGLAVLGWRPGDRVAVVSPNSVETCIAILGLHRAGVVPALMNPRLKSGDIAALIRGGEMVGCIVAADLPITKHLLAELGPNVFAISIGGTLEGVPSHQGRPRNSLIWLVPSASRLRCNRRQTVRPSFSTRPAQQGSRKASSYRSEQPSRVCCLWPPKPD
jgi:acyl-CoA synthetase (AMP-forming)/AMP-acid ligase II